MKPSQKKKKNPKSPQQQQNKQIKTNKQQHPQKEDFFKIPYTNTKRKTTKHTQKK